MCPAWWKHQEISNITLSRCSSNCSLQFQDVSGFTLPGVEYMPILGDQPQWTMAMRLRGGILQINDAGAARDDHVLSGATGKADMKHLGAVGVLHGWGSLSHSAAQTQLQKDVETESQPCKWIKWGV